MELAIQEYINSKAIVSPYDIVNEVLPKFYPVSDIVLDAAKYFTTIIKRKDFCVEQDKLVKYGILSPLKNGKPKSNNILQLFNQYNLIDNRDYLMAEHSAIKTKQRGGQRVNSIEYTMTPKTFFLCLTRSKNSCEYAIYYFHVLEIYDYYEEYFTKMYKEKIENLTENNELLKEDNIAINEYAREQESEIDKLLRKMDNMMTKMDIQNENMQKQDEKLIVMQSTLDKIVKKLDDVAVPPSDDELTERFVLMKKTDNAFCVIRAQKRNIKNAVQKQRKNGYTKVPNLIESELTPNSIYLWSCIRDVLVNEDKIRCKYNEVTLLKISEYELVNIIKQIFDSRKELN